MSPMLPSWMRSRNWRPRFMYFFAIDTTRRRLAWTISCLAARMRRSAAWMSRTARSSAPNGMPISRSSSASSRRASRISSASVTSASRDIPSSPQAHVLVPRLRFHLLLALVTHEVAYPDLARAQPLGEREHIAQRVRRPEHGAHQEALAFLDALGDLRLAFAREELDQPRLAQVDAHRIGGAWMRLVFLDGFGRCRTVAVLRDRQLRLVDLLVIDLERQRRGLGRHAARRDGDLASLRLPGGWIHAHAGLLCASFLGLCLVHELFQAAHGGFHGFRISARLGGANLIAHAALFAARASSANAGDAVGERPLAFHVRSLLEQAAHHALSNVARQRLQAGLALRLFALRERLGGAAPLRALELGDDAARHHALGQRRVLRHELDERRFGVECVRLVWRRRGSGSRRPLAAQRVLAHAESLGGEPREDIELVGLAHPLQKTRHLAGGLRVAPDGVALGAGELAHDHDGAVGLADGVARERETVERVALAEDR